MNNDIKINSKISKYIFNKNKFSLSKPSNTIYNKNLDYCKKYSIKNKKAGFNFYGNNNLCYLYKDHKPSNKMNENLINNYSIKKFKKINKQKNASIYDQSDNNYYFNQLNHFNLHSTDLIKKTNVNNLDKCMNTCLNTPSCNAITYFQEPYKCNFYDNVNLSKTKNNSYDCYTLNSKYKNDLSKIIDSEQDLLKKTQSRVDNNLVTNNSYTKCFTNENHNNYKKLINSYNNICNNEFGEGYIFSNNNNNLNIIKCDNNKIKISCKPSFIENFNNNMINSKDVYKKIVYLLLLIIIIFIFYKIMNNHVYKNFKK